ncbi:kinase-like domain-containing protein [Infundibulicybe gibba]|nr:kinase-like domain-containing protein [Infundibulicybe gibba]
MRLPRQDWSLRHHKQRSAHVLEQRRIASIEHNPTVMIYPEQAPLLTRQGQGSCCTAQSADASGGFGAVYKAIIRCTGQEVAMKCLGHSTRREYEQILDEVALVHRLGRSPWHATFYGAFCTWDRVFIATEFHSGGSLHDYIQKQGGFLHPRVARFYAAELLTAISHAHNLGIVHRDIKPQNILLNKDGHLVVIDPGVGVQLIDRDNGWTDGVCGTDGFMAPEVELGQCYDFRAYYFSWGVTLYIMIVGRLPPRLMRHKGTGCFVEADGPSYYDLKHDTFLGHWERDLLTQVFSPELQNRPTLSQIMKHRYWAGLDWKKIDKKLMRPPMVREPSHPHLRHQLCARLKWVFCC